LILTHLILNLLKGKSRILSRSEWEVAPLWFIGHKLLPKIERDACHLAHLVVGEHGLAVGICAPHVFLIVASILRLATKAIDCQARSKRNDGRWGLVMIIHAFEVALCALVDCISHPAGAVAAQDVHPEHACCGIVRIGFIAQKADGDIDGIICVARWGGLGIEVWGIIWSKIWQLGGVTSRSRPQDQTQGKTEK
jgi:hypothetical protein